MKLPNGPDLKMPELRAPAFLADLYHDLRDRRLLPLVALVLVAIAATPILLSQKSETTLPPVGAGPIAALKRDHRAGAQLTVVEATPGLRDYRRRLRHRTPTDPFRKSTAKADLSGAKLGGGGEGSGGSSSSSATSTSATVKETSSSKTVTESTTNGSGGGSGGEGGGKHHGVLFTFAVDLTIVHSSGSEAAGNKKSDPPQTHKRVLPTTVLPGEKTQVVTYMGLSPKTRKPYFLVSPDVTGVFGEGQCSSGTGTCQLIELEPGFPEIFEVGEGGDRYSVKVTKVEAVVTGHV